MLDLVFHVWAELLRQQIRRMSNQLSLTAWMWVNSLWTLQNVAQPLIQHAWSCYGKGINDTFVGLINVVSLTILNLHYSAKLQRYVHTAALFCVLVSTCCHHTGLCYLKALPSSAVEVLEKQSREKKLCLCVCGSAFLQRSLTLKWCVPGGMCAYFQTWGVKLKQESCFNHSWRMLGYTILLKNKSGLNDNFNF